MTDPGTLYFFCGKMASGKSTLARSLAQHHDAILWSEDELLAKLYPGEVQDVASYVRCAARLKDALASHLCELLGRGLSLVLDFPANTVRQRQWMRELLDASGAPHELHVLEVADEVCLARLAERAAEQPERQATDTSAMFQAVTAHFRLPAPEEGFHLVRHDDTIG